ncbi:MAG: alpha/beta hydrolase [Duncaniella sp.]|nr:alpha/beta hydrolase [Duncaniella sp.]
MRLLTTIASALLLASAPIAASASAPQPVNVVLTATPTDTASMTIYQPENPTGRMIVMLPGGGYEHLAMQHEGHDWAPFFNEQGIAVAVVKYRMPHGDRSLPFGDACDAVKYVRSHSKELGINPSDVGLMGFSAGGHLCSTVATHAEADARPDFHILMYPVVSMERGVTHNGSRDNLLGPKPSQALVADYSNHLRVDSLTPRAFIALSHDDGAVPAKNSVDYYSALLTNGVPASMHIYPTGGHGWGFRTNFRYHDRVVDELRDWLKSF